MSNEFNKKLTQKGGMMIEALAMLGLIAVVTPTMYKKSAERTLEVEDINTATSMRSVMTAADSYVSSHYGELVQTMTAAGDDVQTISMDKLQPYLPYAFNADKLYDFSAPKVSVVRNGNNLTSFVIFPAKEDGENGLGQERTVRIATLVGANGGYVTEKNAAAKGIGGIWSLNSNEETDVKFNEIFPVDADNPYEVYSIVTASSDAINNTNIEEDTDKFLYRNLEEGAEWHNTMRTDLYMGGFDDDTTKSQDGYYNKGNHSIRSVKSLIIGAEDAGDEYGLYINGAAGTEEGSLINSAAFIKGSLEAANSQFTVNENSLTYNSGDMGLFVDNESFNIFSPSETSPGEKNPWFVINNVGRIDHYGEEAHLTQGSNYELTVGDPENPAIKASGTEAGQKSVSLVSDNTFKVDNVNLQNNENYDDQVVMMDGTEAGKGKGDDQNWNKTISYNDTPDFPVRVGSNMKVEGILATAQLDTQNIRAAELEVGSENIDDEHKWLKVDASGIHGRNPDAVSGENNSKKTDTVFDIKEGVIAFATSDNSNLNYDATNLDTDHGAQNSFNMENGKGVELASKEKIDVFMNDDAGELNLRNTKIQQQISGTDAVFSSLEEGTPTTSVKVEGTNFQVQDTDKKVVLSVKGNDSDNETLDPMTRGISETANVAVHGETLFTSRFDNNGIADRKYLKVGSDHNSDAVVNILSKDGGGKQSKVMTVEGDTLYNQNADSNYKDTTNGGTIYIRKGMVEVNPATQTYFESADGFNNTKTDADKGYGVIKASRLVANNPNINNDTNAPAAVPQFFSEVDYKKYNGVDNANGRYDTYMVNPAYTSVMHDIKLTTRGGARLSDILPDFINKGIYITSNTYNDNITKLSFGINSNGKITANEREVSSNPNSIELGTAESWASPYLGFVPAPQCPPGYNRLITMTPQSFMMSQAGQMQRSATGQDHPRGGYAYYTKNQVPEDSAFTKYNNAMGSSNGQYIQQGFANVAVEDDANVDITNVKVDGKNATGTAVANTKGLGLQTGRYNKDSQNNDTDFVPDAQQHPYFLVSYGDTTPPLTIQQSTWLKTQMIPVGKENNSSSNAASTVKGSNKGYTVGWAALMGFVYDKATYESIIDILENKGSDNETDKQNLIAYDGSEGSDGKPSVYWNVFPVRRSTLEAYATVYCYFDRKGIMNELDDDAGKYVDQYDAVKDYKSTNTYEKIDHGDGYLQRLNDPTLKYDEVW